MGQEPLENVENLSEVIEHGDAAVLIFTIMHRTKGDPDHYGLTLVAEAGTSEADEVKDWPVDLDLYAEEMSVADPHEQMSPIDLPGVCDQDGREEPVGASPAPMLIGCGEEDHVVVEGLRLNEDSSARELREACKALGLGMSGSKKVMFQRLMSHSKKRALEDAMALGNAAKPHEHQPRGERLPKQPTADEIAEHELTHVPFKEWCSYCVSCRSRRDAHRQDGEQHDTDGGDPIIAFDFFYTDVTGGELDFMRSAPKDKDAMVVVVAVDKTTGMSRAIPLESKGDQSLVYAAKEILGFISYLGYQGVVIRSDNEPSATALTKMICHSRTKLGLKTVAS